MEYFEQKTIITSLGNMIIPYVREEYILSKSNTSIVISFTPMSGDTMTVSALHVTQGTGRETTNISDSFYFIGKSGRQYLCESFSSNYRLYPDENNKSVYFQLPKSASYPTYFPFCYYDEETSIVYCTFWTAYYTNTTNYVIKNVNGTFGNMEISFTNYSVTNYNIYNQSTYSSMLIDILQNSPEPPGPTPGEDPYSPGGESGEEGGEGNFDNTSDEIEIPDLPTASTVINTGFITLYKANIYDLNDLASYLWSANGLDLETFKKIFADPISAILGLSIFPCSPEITTQDVNVILGNIDTGVGMRKVTNQYRRYDMGTLNLNEYWGGYLDYSPYTSVEIYLPYIGTRTLNADDVMGKALHLVYNIDFLSGSCCAILEVGGTVLYQFMGQCSCPVPVTGRDMTNLVNGVMSVVGAGVGTLVATGGNAALAGASAIGSLASHVTSSKPKIEKSGAMGGMGGMLGVRKPYLVVTRPRQALPASQNTYTGYPSYMTCMLGDLIGFTVMETVHLQDMSATDEEKAEIDRLLKTGVVL